MANSDSGQTSTTPASVVMDTIQVILRHRAFLTRTVLVVTVVVTIISFLLPRWYKSTASVFPAENADLFGALDGVASLAKSFSPGKALSSLTGSSETDRYMAILKSGTVLGAVIQKFDLVHVYEITSYPGERTAKALLSNVEFSVESEGNLTISVYDKDPRRAADMANYFVEMLNKTNSELQVQNARGNREFIEQRYQKNLKDLASAEDSLKQFQKRYGVLALPEQIEASIKAAAELMGQLAAKEVQEGVLRRTMAPEHPSILAAQVEVSELRKKLSQMNTGAGAAPGEMKVFVPFQRYPDLGAEYVRLFRDVEIQYKILQFITPLYEQAKVEERRQTPSVLVLDKASPAERKAKPKVTLYALMAFVISSLLCLLWIFVWEGLIKMRGSDPHGFAMIVSSFREDWLGLKVRRRVRSIR